MSNIPEPRTVKLPRKKTTVPSLNLQVNHFKGDVHVFAKFAACYAGAGFVRGNGENSRTRGRARAV